MEKGTELINIPLMRRAVIESISDNNPLKSRMESMGITEGAEIIPLFKSPFGDPIAYGASGSVIALRSSDCRGIIVMESRL